MKHSIALLNAAILLAALAAAPLWAQENASSVAEARQRNVAGLRHFQAGSLGAALQEFQAAAAANPRESEYPNNVGICYLSMGRSAEARAMFEKALQLRELPLYHYNIGLASVRLGQVEQALAAFRKAVAFDGNYVEAWNQIGSLEFQQRNFSGAEQAWRRASAAGRNAEVESNLGMALLEQNKLEEARQRLERAIQLNPRYALAHFNLGVLLQRQQQLPAAEQSYLLATRADPRAYATYYNLGVVQERQGKKEAAMHSFESFVQLAPPGMQQQIAEARRRIEALRSNQ
ncbi:MAG: tetratricopeptide repeat protein [Leptospirales bacterium]|nr:tetratricopeptide repeat protein [Leptospirales bacterium]